MQIIDGKALAEKIRLEIKKKISQLGVVPGLGVILVGNDSASYLYIKLKEQACKEAGIKFEKAVFPEGAAQKKIVSAIEQFNKRNDIHGILVQLPLPKGYDTEAVIGAIDPKKDVDGFHPQKGSAQVIPPTAAGILKLIESTGVELKSKKAVLLVNSEVFALSIKLLLEQKGVKIDISLNPIPSTLYPHDIIIIALGRPNFLKADMVKDGVIVIDVGTSIVSGKTVGDADFDSFKNKNGWISPVPGGVGPLTVAMLLNNVLELTLKK